MEKENTKKEKVNILGRNGVRISLYTGNLEYGFPDRWSTLHFYHAYPGDCITLCNDEYEFAIASYSLEWEAWYTYTYFYDNDESWATYIYDLSPDSYQKEKYIFHEECYFRINCKRVDSRPLMLQEENIIANSLQFYSVPISYEYKMCFQKEIEEFVKKIELQKGMKFLVLTDTHYVVNGTWEDTLLNMRKVISSTEIDAIIHLGDITDGMVSKEVNLEYISRVVDGMKKLGVPLYLTLGNHDSNYFYNNRDKFTDLEQYEYYLKDCHNQGKKLYYYKDFSEIKVRALFLHSFDYREMIRYGFSNEEVKWFEETLRRTPKGYRILIFSHVPPLPEIHFWSDKIRNGEKMIELAEQHEERTGQKILAWIHGHNHADAVYKARKFPIIAIGCNKFEYFLDKGSYTPERKINHPSQDLWDILCIQADIDELRFIRFGAGKEERII